MPSNGEKRPRKSAARASRAELNWIIEFSNRQDGSSGERNGQGNETPAIGKLAFGEQEVGGLDLFWVNSGRPVGIEGLVVADIDKLNTSGLHGSGAFWPSWRTMLGLVMKEQK